MCYLDESGVTENVSTTHFVLVGFAVQAEQWKWMEKAINRCKVPLGLENTEIHTAWMHRRYPEQEHISGFDNLDFAQRRAAVKQRRKGHLLRLAASGTRKQLKSAQRNYRKSDAYIHLTHVQRVSLLRKVADTIGRWQDARIFAEAADKSFVYSSNLRFDHLFDYAFTEVVQRYEYFLRNKGRSLGTTLYGLLVQDNNQTVSRRLTDLMRRFHKQGTKWTDIDHIVETPFFVDSHLTSMVQIADLCGFAIRRFFENGETDLFNRIYDRFDRGNRGVVGVRHNTHAGCSCRVCKDHS